MIQWLRSLLFAISFYVGTFFYVVAAIVASWIGERPARAVVHAWAGFHYLLASRVLGVRTRVVGAVPSGVHLLAVKHQSMFETIEMVRLIDTPVVVLKRELAALPLFGGVTRRYGVIPVEREAGAKALREMLVLGRKAVAVGRPIAIFPEGTRVPPGQTPPLRPGFAGLYKALGLPVVPIAVDSGRLWGRGLLKRAGVVTFRVGETIPAGLPRDEAERRVHAAINALEPSTAEACA